VAAVADPGEVLVSSTVSGAAAGSGCEFSDRGTYRLRGVPGRWRLFAA
jgi:class 3 adenylate cyclase